MTTESMVLRERELLAAVDQSVVDLVQVELDFAELLPLAARRRLNEFHHGEGYRAKVAGTGGRRG